MENQKKMEDLPLPTRPPERQTFNVNGQDQEVFMSAGLMRRIAPLIGSLESFSSISQDMGIQDAVTVMAFTPRTKHGEPIHNYGIDDFEMTLEESDRFLAWIMGHVFYFFVNMVNNSKRLAETMEPALMKYMTLTQSLSGSEASTT